MEDLTQDHDKLMRHLRGIRYIVINRQYGGFSLSRKAILKYLELSGTPYELQSQPDRDTQSRLGHRIVVNNSDFCDRDIPRDDPALVATVRQLGSEANGEYAILKVVEVPADVKWYIEVYDGKEWVAEVHRTWR